MRRPGIIFLFAIVIGALLSALVYGNLKTQRAELEAAKRAMELGTIDVLVANQSIRDRLPHHLGACAHSPLARQHPARRRAHRLHAQ